MTLLYALWACRATTVDGDPPTHVSHDTDSGGAPEGERVVFESGPSLSVPDPKVPLARTVSACATTESGIGTTLVLDVSTDGHRFEVRSDTPARCHTVGLFGTKAGRTYCVEVRAEAQGAVGAAAEPVCFATAELPADFPRMTFRRNERARRQDGVLFVNLGAHPVDGPFYFVAFDTDFDVVWLAEGINCSAFELLEDGHLLYESGDVVEIDLYGQEVRRFTHTQSTTEGIRVDSNQFHHEVHLHPDGTLSSLSTSSVDVPDYPASYEDPSLRQAGRVRDQTVVRWDADGRVVQRTLLGPLLDIHRIGYDSLEDTVGGFEWAHANAASRTPADDGWLVSLRHQDAVVAVSDAGQLQWILGHPENWTARERPYLLTPVGAPFDWPYHQHAPEWDADGTLRLFDNHNYAAAPWDGTTPSPPTETRSRVVQYRIDPVARTVRQDWEYGDLIDGPVFAWARGDVDRLPNGNVLTLFPTIIAEHGVWLTDEGKGATAARVVELAFDPDPVPVLDVEFWSDAQQTAAGWYAYRVILAPAPWDHR